MLVITCCSCTYMRSCVYNTCVQLAGP